MIGRLIALAAIVILLFVGVGAVQQGYWGSAVASEDHVEFNETFTVDEGETITLTVSDKAVAYAPQTDINVTQSGTDFDAAGNWSWNRHDGTLEIASSSSFTNGSDAAVSGYYAVPNQQQNATKNIATLPLGGFGGAWELAAGAMVVLAAVAVVASRA